MVAFHLIIFVHFLIHSRPERPASIVNEAGDVMVSVGRVSPRPARPPSLAPSPLVGIFNHSVEGHQINLFELVNANVLFNAGNPHRHKDL